MTVAAQAADALAVEVINASEPTLCAEKDNVYLKLQSGEARRFTVEAVHPAYAGTIVVDRFAPDFTKCDMSNDPVFKSERRQVTIYETAEWRLVGHTFPTVSGGRTKCRCGSATGSRTACTCCSSGRAARAADEVLVLYPADGYWRARPMPPANLRWSAYGSSFLIGPVETEGRPLVDIKDVAFDPETKTFTLNFVRGGSATLRLEKLDDERMVLDVNLPQPVARAAVRGAALDVRERRQFRRGARRLARQRQPSLAAGAGDGLQARQRGRALGRAARAVAPQHQRARHGVPRISAAPTR